ncbi:hypothetical protein KDD93_01990 [Campylobacter sp. faydin G-24]|uniref:TraT complement resistance protein n=1 Tax=Campylobacter anatolicus TaxID=2829105 RepID=A0ABS5HII5_9BACT|nr:complement resistance protein TraT [Campylobacter anatolicus]MBR8463342.1 hypothetical protein [Campylobacter anatolicus]
MKKLINLCIFAFVLFLSGCATSSTPSLYTQSSVPIFVTTQDTNTTIFINFKNSSGAINTLENSVKAKFINRGYILANDMNTASIVILGDLMSLQRLEVKDPNVFLNLGYGFGSFGSGYGIGVGTIFGADDFYDHRTNSYIYKANVSVMIRTKEREQSTILSIQSGRNTYSPSYIMPFIEDKIATQILNFFY